MDARPCGTLPCTTITTTTITTTATNTTTSVTAATTSSSSSRGTLPTTHHRQKHHHHHSSSSEGYHYPRVHHQAHQPHTVIPGTDTPKQFSPSGAGDLGLQQYYPVRIARPDGEERAFLQQGGKSHTLSRNHKDKESETARTYIKPPGNKDVSLIQDLHLHRLDNLPPQRTLMCPIPPISSPKSAYSVSPTAEYYYHGSSFQHPAAAPPAAHSGLPYQAGSGGTARDQPKQKDTLTGSFTSQCTNKSRFTWHNCMPNLKTSPKNRRDSNSRKQQLSSSSSSSSSSGNSSNRSSNNNFNNNNGSSVNKSTGSACCQVSGHKLQSGSGSTRGKNSVNKAVLCCGDISCEDLHKVSTLVSPSSPPPADFNLLDKRGYPNLELPGAPNPSLLHLPGPTSVTDVEVLRCNPSSHGVQNSFSSPPKALPQAMGDRHQDLQCQQQHYQPVHFTQPEYQAVDDRPLSPAASPVPSSPDYHQYSSSYDRSHQYRQSPHQHHHHDNLTSSLSSSPPPSPQSASPHVPLPPSPTLPHQLSSPREGSFQSNKESYSPSPSGTEQDPYTSPSYREVLPSSASPPAVITLESNTHHNAMYQKQQQRHHHTLQYEESQHQLQRQQQQQHRPIKNLSLRESCYESEVI